MKSHKQLLERDAITSQLAVNPYLLPEHRQGWRGVGLPGNRKRKAYTVLHNERVLVTALLVLPGERMVRHSHESGELSIEYRGDLQPIVEWFPPGDIHPPVAKADEGRVNASDLLSKLGENALAPLIRQLLDEQTRLRKELDALHEGEVRPHLYLDVLFPPFATTIHDPEYGDPKTVYGQWYD